MKISYTWLCKYLPEQVEPEKLSAILTSLGLEVELLERFESIKGGLEGLIVGEVVSCEQHPNADKLKLTKVDIGSGAPLQIVCGATNIGVGQKVIVAPVGATIYPLSGDPVTMKVAKIRGIESYGMICAEDEIGLSDNHEGILILPPGTEKGRFAKDIFEPYSDWIYEIGLTPNRMDAMSHIGVAKDVCAWLSHHQNKIVQPTLPFENIVETDNSKNDFKVIIENTNDCRRYSALTVNNIKVAESPAWLQNFLKSIGQRPINNIVDITNFVLHETGQPLHAFDADALTSKKVVIKNLPEGTIFKTLDDVERKLSTKDLMICNDDEPVCIAGVFGGIKSGVSNKTVNIFLESAWFSPSSIRTTSLKHGLRTEAAVRFEKGVDISGTVAALSRAAQLITDIAGGKINGSIIDVYPVPAIKKEITLKYDYLKKLSGKQYPSISVKNILSVLEFDILDEDNQGIKVAVPFSKADVSIPADIVEEIIRVDGLNNITIPSTITITPSIQEHILDSQLKEKLSQMLAGLGFNEIVTNSITNSKNYSEANLSSAVRLLNNLSADLDIMRPSMLETGLEILSYNINRKNNKLCFFELGKTYHQTNNAYNETEKICFWITGKKQNINWKQQVTEADFFTAKGIVIALLESTNIKNIVFEETQSSGEGNFQMIMTQKNELGKLLQVNNSSLQKFSIKQPVVYLELVLESLIKAAQTKEILYKEFPQFPSVERDLSIIINKKVNYQTVMASLDALHLRFLQHYDLFDIYEGGNIGSDKKSFAINFKFLNKEKTLTDGEVETDMQTITNTLINDLQAEIRQ